MRARTENVSKQHTNGYKIYAKIDENRSRHYVRKSSANNSENHSTQSAIKHKKLPTNINNYDVGHSCKRKRTKTPQPVPRFHQRAEPGGWRGARRACYYIKLIKVI